MATIIIEYEDHELLKDEHWSDAINIAHDLAMSSGFQRPNAQMQAMFISEHDLKVLVWRKGWTPLEISQVFSSLRNAR